MGGNVSVYNIHIRILYTNPISLLKDFIYPENIAYPVGGVGQEQYAVMEMHYDNPSNDQGKNWDKAIVPQVMEIDSSLCKAKELSLATCVQCINPYRSG